MPKYRNLDASLVKESLVQSPQRLLNILVYLSGNDLRSLLEQEASTHGIEGNYFVDAILNDLKPSKAKEAYNLGIGPIVAKSFQDLEVGM